jgi:hypothetical protein
MIGVLLAAILQASVPIRSLDKGISSQIDVARQAAVQSDAEWNTLWSQHAGARVRPAVDFNKEMVLAVFLGARPTAGFSVEIVGAREEGGALVVSYRESRPPSGSVTAQVLTSPYHLVAVPKHGDVKWERVS